MHCDRRAAGARWGLVAMLLGVLACDSESGLLFRPRPAGRPASHAELLNYAGPFYRGLADLELLAQELDEAEASPFDGLMLDLGIPGEFESVEPNWEEPMAAAALVAELPFERLKANFQVWNISTQTFDLQSDTEANAYLERLRRATSLVRDAGLRGYFFDTQTYGGSTFWRFLDGTGETFEAREALFERRGYERMSAILEVYPNITILVSMGYSEAYREACIEGVPREGIRYAFLPAFLDGMQRARAERRTSAAIHDVFLPSYATEELRSFAMYYSLIHGDVDALSDAWVPGVATYRFPEMPDASPDAERFTWPDRPVDACDAATRERLLRNLPAGFGLILSYGNWDSEFVTDPARFSENFYTPDEWQNLVAAALLATDRYVWAWLGNMPHWPTAKEAGTPIPDAYRDATRRAVERTREAR